MLEQQNIECRKFVENYLDNLPECKNAVELVNKSFESFEEKYQFTKSIDKENSNRLILTKIEESISKSDILIERVIENIINELKNFDIYQIFKEETNIMNYSSTDESEAMLVGECSSSSFVVYIRVLETEEENSHKINIIVNMAENIFQYIK